MYRCKKCGGTNAHWIEIRMSNISIHNITPMNAMTDDIEQSDMPHDLMIPYCHSCEDVQECEYIKE